MPSVWRISNHPDLTGEGGRKFAARWHSAGRPIIYAAEHPEGAMLEILVHVRVRDLPETIRLHRIELPDAAPVETIVAENMPDDWTRQEDGARRIGDEWLASRRSLSLRVPSAIMPHVWNVLLNPEHPAIRDAAIVSSAVIPLDPRLKS